MSWTWLVGGWMIFATLALLGLWARLLPQAVDAAAKPELHAGLVMLQPYCRFGGAALAFAVASLFVVLKHWFGRREPAALGRLLTAAWALAAGFVLLSIWLWFQDNARLGPLLDLDWLLLPWDTNPTALRLGVIALGLSTFLLLIGCWTRLSAISAWVLMASFDNLNHYLTDTGEVVRYTLLFFILLTPSGAVWSVDRWRRPTHPALSTQPIYVWSWWLRLMFLQLVVIYFVTGLCKLPGESWQEGVSLYRVLSCPSLTRFSLSQLPVNYPLLMAGSYIVWVWEMTFPLLVLFRWTRLPALLMGVLFHVGIWVTMEIGFFAPYMLCFYVPLAPWERLSRRQPATAEDSAGAGVQRRTAEQQLCT